MNSNRTSTPPPAHNLQCLSADLLAVAAKNLLEQLAHSDWAPAVKLREALDTYECVRMGQVLRDDDPQSVQLNDPPAPITERSLPNG